MHIVMLLHKSVEFDSRVRREASALAAAGYRVTLLELAPVPGGTAMLDGFTRRSCQPPRWLARRLPFNLYRIAFLAWFVGWQLHLRPDVVHAHDAAMLLPGIVGAQLTGARLVYDSHELATSVPYRERAWTWFVASIERLAVPRCAGVITVSDGIAERLRVRYRLSSTPAVVRNVTALRTNGRGRLRERLGIDRHTPLILHQGAPAPDRGCEALVAAMQELPQARLAFLGDPEPGYGVKLRGLIKDLGVQERVSLLGSVPLEDLLAHTSEADVGVTLLQDTCENHRLALPNKLFEYVAAGVPVVASALPETQRLVQQHGLGWCVTPGDQAGLVRALGDALSACRDPGLRARLTEAAQELSWSREQQRLLGLYAKLDRRAAPAVDAAPSARRTPAAAPVPAATPALHAPATARVKLVPGDHEPMRAQDGNPRQLFIRATGPAGERRSERDGAHLQLVTERGPQRGHADQAGVGVGSRHTRLPDRDRPLVGEHPAGLAEGRPDAC
ncbi:MAG TPA: glycosyltransferase family 4 protein [Solirubrobacteraceae bacterium]|nr:glycosyltransferase family 4 protein [Solirubrobacteraceae bacterium]